MWEYTGELGDALHTGGSARSFFLYLIDWRYGELVLSFPFTIIILATGPSLL